MTTKHTPGPWAQSKSGTGINAGEISIANISNGNVRFDDFPDELQANARLIVAAPDLLEALRVAEKFVAQFDDDDDYTDGQVETINAIRAAIAKAIGETL